MKTDELLNALAKHGIDEEGINDRFGENYELYEKCFISFLESANHALLEETLRNQNIAAAFDASHSLKGISGNLGLNAYYSAVCALVESLRANRLNTLAEEYEAVKRELDDLRLIGSGGQVSSASPEKAAKPRDSRRTKDAKRRRSIFIFGTAASIAVVFLITAFSFFAIGNNYSDKTKLESGDHILETGKQIGLYIEEQIANDWKVAISTGQSIADSEYVGDDAIFGLLQKQSKTWGVTDLMLYTEDGYCIYASGRTVSNDIASDMIAEAYKTGASLSVIESEIVYTLPIETQNTFNGSRIVAISAVRSMASVLNEQDFTSFENNAWIYLTRDNGMVISMLTSSDAAFTFNINTLFDSSELSELSKTASSRGPFAAPDAAAFYMKGSGEDRYVISVPISTDNTAAVRLRLFYIVPEAVVNSTMNGFSKQLTGFSIVIIVVLVALASLTFLAMYSSRSKRFDAEISSREQMFDKHITETIATYEGTWEELMTAQLKAAGTVAAADDKRIKLVWD